MTDELPAPLVPADGDLRGYPFTPIFRARLFGSSFHARATDAEWRAGVTLWLKSWDQVPAGTLPDDDIDLCRLAELGRDLKSWGRVKARALHGWAKCSDGRLHHAVVAEGVLEAWEGRRKASEKGKAGASKRWRGGEAGAMPAPVPQPPKPDSPGIARAMPGDSNRQGEGERQGDSKRQGQSTAAPPTDAPASPVEVDDDPAGMVEVVPLGFDRTECGDVVRLWNEMAKSCGLSEVAKITQKRRRLILARLKDLGGNPLEGIRGAFAKVAASDWMTGRSPSRDYPNWRANFDYVLREDSFTKLMEANDGGQQRTRGAEPYRNGFVELAAEAERRAQQGDGGPVQSEL